MVIPWTWLTSGSNSAAVQALGAVLSTAVGVVTIIVLAFTWGAIRKPSTLGPKEAGRIQFDTRDHSMTVQYRGADRIECMTIIMSKEEFSQEHFVKEGTTFVKL
jgi:hypothetical protein